MKQALVLLALLALIAPANAIGLRLFFDTAGVADGVALGGVSPAMINPTVVGSGRLYIWANIVDDGLADLRMNSIGFNVLVKGNVALTGKAIYNFSNFQTRWSSVNPGTLTAAKIDNVRLAAAAGTNGNIGVRNYNYNGWDNQFDPTTKSTLLGWIEVAWVGPATGNDGVFMQIGNQIEAFAGYTLGQHAYFGFGDDELGVMGNSRYKPVGNETGFILDAFVPPEPASLLLLGLAGLALRRR